jgi:hypothetical protein
MEHEYNIQMFLNSQTRPFYEKVIQIIKDLENITHTNVVVFGGLVRRIIESYYDFTCFEQTETHLTKSSDKYFSIPDVDVWFLNGPCTKDCDYQHSWFNSFTTWERHANNIFNSMSHFHKMTSKEYPIYNLDSPRINYGVVNMTIDDIKFDMCTNINKFTNFEKLSDYVCNNLYFDVNGKMNIRVKEQRKWSKTDFKVIDLCPYSIEEIIEQIKNKKLINMINIDKESIEIMDSSEKIKQYYIKKMKYREEKMLKNGYSY